MRKISFAVITKIWGFICVLIAIYMGKDVIFSYILTIAAFLHLIVQGKWNLIMAYSTSYWEFCSMPYKAADFTC